MRKIFITYHHTNDQWYKNRLGEINRQYNIFVDRSVDVGDISDDLTDQSIRSKIRDEYLRDSTVTIVLVGLETKNRKHVDWEIYSSMYDGTVNKKSGILVINLPQINCTSYHAGHGNAEKQLIYPENSTWMSITSRAEYDSRYPYMPERIIDNLLAAQVEISVVDWSKIENYPSNLAFLIEATFADRENCQYDLSRPMRRNNS